MIRKLFTPTLRLSFGLVALTTSILLISQMIGLIPDSAKSELDARARIAEALAVQLSAAAARSDTIAIQETLAIVEKRSDQILSAALRRENGTILMSTGNHGNHWVSPGDGKSTSTHVQVPLLNGEAQWGSVEIAFRPLPSQQHILGIPYSILALFGFLVGSGYIGYFFVLRRALRELDPSGVVPERVQNAFNTLAEGVLILDEKESVLLANDAFAQAVGSTSKKLFSSSITKLNWRQWSDGEAARDYPWRQAMAQKKSMTAVQLGIRTPGGDTRSFMVNATCILDGKGEVCGAIATFDDVTDVERKNEDLKRAVRKLEQSEEEISRRNRQLEYLANHDPLSGCLNRRAFFAKFETNLQTAHRDKVEMSCLMVDLDHFKSINDRFGHSVGDQVITNVADILKTAVGEDDLVGRYGGEEFCIALYGLNVQESRELAERIRLDIQSASVAWLPNGEAATSSLGFAMRPDEYTPDTAMALVELADQALYVAKETGRNQVVFYEDIPEDAKKGEEKKQEEEPAEVPAEKHLRRATDKLGLPAADVDVAALIAQQVTDAQPAEAPEASIPSTVVTAAPAAPASVSAESAYDPLTQLPTRVIFMDRVSQSIARAARNDKSVGVLQISIAAFEELSDIFGDQAISDLVTHVGNRLVTVLRRSDTVSLVGDGERVPTVSRLSDCKFAVEISDVENTDTIIWIVKRIFECLAEPFEVNGEKLYINSNIGVSVFPEDGDDAELLVRNANTAERHAREADGNSVYMFFSKEMNENSRRNISIEAGLRKALEAGQFALFYQPIVDAQSGKLTSAEALLRCNSPELSDYQIWELISVAEQTGLMSPIGEWVMKTATAQLVEWRRAGIELQKISVNCSAIQLRDPASVERLLQIINQMELPTQHLQVEITETAMLENINAASATLKQLQQLGVQIALDDFGTGQSSLTYLRRFRPDILKIDRSFISEIDVSGTDEMMVSALIALAHRMGMGVVAEGIETLDQMEKLRNLGCDEVQGFGIARPMPVGAMTRWLKLFLTETGLGSTPMHQDSKVA